MTAIDWQATVARLDAAPNINSTTGQSVLKRLLETGRAYDAAGRPDVMHESEAHRRWANLRPSERLGQPEPDYFETAYYTRLTTPQAGGTRSALFKAAFTAEDLKVLPNDALAAYRYWERRDVKIATQIASYYIAKAEEEKRKAAAARAPMLGWLQNDLVVAVAAAEAFLG